MANRICLAYGILILAWSMASLIRAEEETTTTAEITTTTGETTTTGATTTGETTTTGPTTTGETTTTGPTTTGETTTAGPTTTGETTTTGATTTGAITTTGATTAGEATTTGTAITTTGATTTAGTGSAATTEAPTTQRPGGTVTAGLPQCRDTKPSGWCSGQIQTRPRSFCQENLVFGRYQCCASCAMFLNPAIQADANGVVPAAAATNELKPKCEDQKSSDGTPFTAWCLKWAFGKPQGAKISCHVASVQVKCMSTCKLC